MIKSLLLLAAIYFSTGLFGQPLITFKKIVSGFSYPVDVVEQKDSLWLFVVEKTGTIRIVKDSILQPKPFLNISTLVSTGGEQGLLSLAFHPQYATNGFFYIYYTNTGGNIVVARYSRIRADSADPASGVILMNIPKPFANHNGGKLTFGVDNYLYFGTGDGGSGGDPYNNAQNDSSLLGKMLRIDVNNLNPPYYNIPPTNPFAGSTSKQQQIIADGLRNPWRYSFDKITNDMWIADVGQNLWEEVNVVPYTNRLNRNYGWHCLEGTHVYNAGCTTQSNNVLPIFEYPHNDTSGGYSITGGYVYRGTEFPALQGYYLFTDYATGNGWLTKSNGAGGYTTTIQHDWLTSISSFGQRANGTLYVTQLSGTLYKVIASSILAVKLISFTGKESGNKYMFDWQIADEERGDVYIVEKRNKSGDLFTEVSSISVNSGRLSNHYTLLTDRADNETFYRLRIQTATGQAIYSQIIRFDKNTKQSLKSYSTGNMLTIFPPANTKLLQLTDVTGRMLWQAYEPSQSAIQVALNNRGIFIVRALVDDAWQSVKIVY